MGTKVYAVPLDESRFSVRHPDAAQPLNAWHAIVKKSAFESPHDVRAAFASASFLGGSKTVFNIGGNKYRLVAHMRYDLGRVYVRSVMTHAEYDRRSLEGAL